MLRTQAWTRVTKSMIHWMSGFRCGSLRAIHTTPVAMRHVASNQTNVVALCHDMSFKVNVCDTNLNVLHCTAPLAYANAARGTFHGCIVIEDCVLVWHNAPYAHLWLHEDGAWRTDVHFQYAVENMAYAHHSKELIVNATDRLELYAWPMITPTRKLVPALGTHIGSVAYSYSLDHGPAVHILARSHVIGKGHSLFKLDLGAEVTSFQQSFSVYMDSLSVSADGTLLVLVVTFGGVYVLRACDGQVMHVRVLPKRLYAGCFVGPRKIAVVGDETLFLLSLA